MSDDYKVNGKEYSLMSPTNERILNRLVNNNVYCNMTQEIEFIINALLEGANDSSAPFDVNDYDAAIENGMEPVCEDCSVPRMKPAYAHTAMPGVVWPSIPPHETAMQKIPRSFPVMTLRFTSCLF